MVCIRKMLAAKGGTAQQATSGILRIYARSIVRKTVHENTPAFHLCQMLPIHGTYWYLKCVLKRGCWLEGGKAAVCSGRSALGKVSETNEAGGDVTLAHGYRSPPFVCYMLSIICIWAAQSGCVALETIPRANVVAFARGRTPQELYLIPPRNLWASKSAHECPGWRCCVENGACVFLNVNSLQRLVILGSRDFTKWPSSCTVGKGY